MSPVTKAIFEALLSFIAASWSLLSLEPFNTTFDPLPKKAFAISNPSPLEAPVTNTVLIFVDMMFSFQDILITYGFLSCLNSCQMICGLRNGIAIAMPKQKGRRDHPLSSRQFREKYT
jgi:hypothetical protein